jgi:hypothetical protein
MAAADRLTFERAETTYFVPRHCVFEARARGETALRDHLGPALNAVFDRILPRDDPHVFLVRDLKVDFPFAVENGDAAELAHVWASEIARSLMKSIRDGDGVVHFINRPSFLAQFVADVAAGRDTGCWYYDSFISLRALPRSAMIRETIVREPEHAAAVLFELARTHHLEAVLSALHDAGAHAILETAFPHSDPTLAPSARMIEVLLALADEISVRSSGSSFATPHNAIRLCVAMRATSPPSVAMVDIRTHVDRLLAFTSLLTASDDPWRVVEALIDGNAAAAMTMSARLADAATIEFFARLAAARPDVVTCAAGTFASSSTPQPGDQEASAFAGLALLLQPLAELMVDDGLEIDDDPDLRRAIAVKCAIGANPVDVECDPIICLFAGTPRDETDRVAVDDGIATTLAHQVMAAFASRLFGFAGSSEEFLYANFCAGRGAIRETDDAIVIELPHVPLEIVLHLAGIDGRRFTLPWIPDRTIELRLGGAA